MNLPLKFETRAWATTPAALAAIGLALIGARPAAAEDIIGVQNASIDQPQVAVLLQREGEPGPIGGTPTEGFYISAFLDTGSSGVLISTLTADQLGLDRLDGVKFYDVGVGGQDEFEVSEEIIVRVARNPNADVSQLESFDLQVPNIHTQVGPTTPPVIPGLDALDIVGMPALLNKVLVADARALNMWVETEFLGEGGPLASYVYDQNTPYNPASTTDPGIPPTARHVELSYGDFERFTTVTPEGAQGPTLVHNPFIGPDPVAQLDPNPPVDNTPPVSIGYNGNNSSGSFLFDTGAAASFISTALAQDLGVSYVDGTFGTDDPVLAGVPLDQQFDLIVGGIGGVVTLSGFFLDHLVLHTQEGSLALDDPNNLRYLGAPVVVGDISLFDPVAMQELTLDGVFGMNFLVASIFLDGLLGLGDLATGPYDWITYDEQAGILGLTPVGVVVPEPGSLALAGVGAALLAACAWRRRRVRRG
jgi:hypothetical protein